MLIPSVAYVQVFYGRRRPERLDTVVHKYGASRLFRQVQFSVHTVLCKGQLAGLLHYLACLIKLLHMNAVFAADKQRAETHDFVN